MEFHFDSWLVYFYFYCICGWIFESTYVSVRTKKLTNRGFMKGPWLPLYGSGAILVLLVTLPFQQYPVAVYFAGAIAATILEYITGVLMVKIFKVRYWDYSDQKIQFQGHICLSSSIAWGFLSIIMVYAVHKPVVVFIGKWNEEILSIVTFIITIFMVYDFANAFREAMDLRTLIIQAEDIRKRLNAALEEQKEHLNEKKEQFAQAVEERREHLMQSMEEKKEQLNQAVTDTKEQLNRAIEETKERREEAAAERKEHLEKTIAELTAARENLRNGMEKHSVQLLLHNPGASYKGLDEESAEIKRRLLERRRK